MILAKSPFMLLYLPDGGYSIRAREYYPCRFDFLTTAAELETCFNPISARPLANRA